MSTKEFNPDPSFTAWGPLIRQPYIIQPITYNDIIIAGVLFGAAMLFGLLAIYMGIQQTRASRRPLKSAYIWMIWLELAASIVIAIECLLYLLKVIRPSFYFYMSILLNWSIQVQLLLQIIINRIRVILSDRRKGRIILISVAIIVTMINISVFCIWMPARLEISQRWININNIWDRIEKILYLLIDGSLNWYFIRIVKLNLVSNGLEKYSALVRFNQRIIVVSMLMDVMIIAAMNIPNGFVYAIFHPLAYLVKLNIEMSMANLIKKIAMENRRSGAYSYPLTFTSQSIGNTVATKSTVTSQNQSIWSKSVHRPKSLQSQSSKEQGILKTEEYFVQSDLRPTSQLEALAMGKEFENSYQEHGSSSYQSSEFLTVADIEGLPSTSKDFTLPNDVEIRMEDWTGDEEVLVRPEPALPKRQNR